MIVCIDTNTVVQALAQHHSFHPILEAWVAGHVTWAVSTPILLEYQEVLTAEWIGTLAEVGAAHGPR